MGKACVCTVRRVRRTVHAHRRFKITLPNTDQAHKKYLWATTSNFSQARSILPDDGSQTIRNKSEWFLIVF